MSYRVQAEPLVLVFLVAAASLALYGGRHPASPGCDGATPPHLCRRIQTLARCDHPHPHSHLNHSHQAHLPQQSPQVVECWKGWRSILTIRSHSWKPSIPNQGPSERHLILYNFRFHTNKVLENKLIVIKYICCIYIQSIYCIHSYIYIKYSIYSLLCIPEHASIKVKKTKSPLLFYSFFKIEWFFCANRCSHVPTNTQP